MSSVDRINLRRQAPRLSRIEKPVVDVARGVVGHHRAEHAVQGQVARLRAAAGEGVHHVDRLAVERPAAPGQYQRQEQHDELERAGAGAHGRGLAPGDAPPQPAQTGAQHQINEDGAEITGEGEAQHRAHVLTDREQLGGDVAVDVTEVHDVRGQHQRHCHRHGPQDPRQRLVPPAAGGEAQRQIDQQQRDGEKDRDDGGVETHAVQERPEDLPDGQFPEIGVVIKVKHDAEKREYSQGEAEVVQAFAQRCERCARVASSALRTGLPCDASCALQYCHAGSFRSIFSNTCASLDSTSATSISRIGSPRCTRVVQFTDCGSCPRMVRTASGYRFTTRSG